MNIGAGLLLSDLVVEFATCAALQKPGDVATVLTPFSQFLTAALYVYGITTKEGPFVVKVKVTKNKKGCAECDFDYIGVYKDGSYRNLISGPVDTRI